MLDYNFIQRLRHKIKKVPGASRLYGFLNLLFSPEYSKDGLMTIHIPHFLKESNFNKAYAAAFRQEKISDLQWRLHTLCWAGKQASCLNGDFVECGVNRGFMSAGVMEYINFKKMDDRKFYLFDTYCGLVEEFVTIEDTAAYRNDYPDSYQYVTDSFGKYKNVNIVKGPVPITFENISIEKVAYLHIDMNCALPERAALEFFWPKIVPGGIVILDDYGFSGHKSQADTAQEFADNIEHQILCLPTGQGLMVKKHQTHFNFKGK